MKFFPSRQERLLVCQRPQAFVLVSEVPTQAHPLSSSRTAQENVDGEEIGSRRRGGGWLERLGEGVPIMLPKLEEKIDHRLDELP